MGGVGTFGVVACVQEVAVTPGELLADADLIHSTMPVSPIRAGVNRQKSFRSQFSFVIRLTHCCPRRPFRTRHPNPSFRLLIPDANRRAIACAEAIRSVTHLVLALAGR